ncbi:MAG: hypothetical protein DMG14_15840, partial [Acidobacteria bacterium]
MSEFRKRPSGAGAQDETGHVLDRQKIPSLWRPLRQGAIAAGSATWGAVASHFGIRSALLLAGSGTLTMTGWVC